MNTTKPMESLTPRLKALWREIATVTTGATHAELFSLGTEMQVQMLLEMKTPEDRIKYATMVRDMLDAYIKAELRDIEVKGGA